jgi:hypothetical protein
MGEAGINDRQRSWQRELQHRPDERESAGSSPKGPVHSVTIQQASAAGQWYVCNSNLCPAGGSRVRQLGLKSVEAKIQEVLPVKSVPFSLRRPGVW